MASTVPTGGDLILDGDDLSFETEEVDGERLSVIVVYPQRASVISVSEILQKLFPDVQRSQLYNRLSRSNIKQKSLSARLVSQLRDAGAIPASTHRPSVVSRDDALKIIANLKKSPIVPRPRRPKDETDWSGRAETRDGEASVAIGDAADANHADDVEEDDEEAIGDDDDDDFFLPGTAPSKEKRRGGKSRMMTEKVIGVLTTTSSKCGRGRKQCPHCQRKVATCRTKCPDCSYQFVVTPPKVNGGDGGGVLSSASPAVTKSSPPPPPPSSSRQETAKRQGNGKRRRNRKKDTAEGPSSKTSRSNGGGSESESEMNQRSNGAAPEAKKSAAALSDLESRTVSSGPVGKGYKRCPKCGKVQNASCVKCAKCSFVFVHKSPNGSKVTSRHRYTGRPVMGYKSRSTSAAKLSSSPKNQDKSSNGGGGSGVIKNRIVREQSGNLVDVAGLYYRSREAKRRATVEPYIQQRSDQGESPVLKQGYSSVGEQCMSDMIECLSNDGIINALRSVYDKQMEDFQAIEKAYKNTVTSYDEAVSLQEESEREIQTASQTAGELTVQLAASQQELRQLEEDLNVALETKEKAKRDFEKRCLEQELLRIKLKEVLGDDYTPTIY